MEASNKYGVKESLEALHLILVCAEAIKEAKKDGMLNWFDIPKFAPIVSAAQKAFQGSHMIDNELKDLNPVESQNLASAAINAAQALMKAILLK